MPVHVCDSMFSHKANQCIVQARLSATRTYAHPLPAAHHIAGWGLEG